MASYLDHRLIEGIQLFNNRKFFESHEILEDLWREEVDQPKKFYQGLIQSAVALHHYLNKNWRGALTEYYFAQESLDKYRPKYMGIDVEELLDKLDLLFNDVEEKRKIDLKTEYLPKISIQE